MKKILIILYVLTSTGAECYMAYDLYGRLNRHERGLDVLYDHGAVLEERFRFMETTVNMHDEKIDALLQVKRGK